MNRLSLFVLLLGAFASIVAAASAPTFCKCTCFTNSTIIEIKSKSSSLGNFHLKEPGEDPEDPSSGDGDPSADPGDGAASSSLADSLLADTEASAALVPRAGKSHTGRATLSPSCNQCNRAFCLSQSLPICKGAAEKDVVTMCFQRDSRKDMIIVWGFILGTAGLLGWAALRKVMDMHDRPGGIAGGIAGGLTRGSGREGETGLGIAGGTVGGTGADVGRGRYVGLSGHSREGSAVFG